MFVEIPWTNKDSLNYVGLFISSILTGATLVISGPGQALIIAAGKSFNPIIAGLVGGSGLALGETSGFLLGRSLGRKPDSAPITSGIVSRITSVALMRWRWLFIILLALIPNPFLISSE
ncbi:MAG: VTT domain-containing protein [SAR202 cluster bacterium]|nr:VTT domain-containing protein [SAR202 cluster bacterium]